MVEEIPKFLLQEFTCDISATKTGGESCLFKGTHPLLAGEVAIKRWSNPSDGNEVKLLMENINHKNIIQFLGILIDNESKSTIGYIMPYVSIGSLEDVIYNRKNNYDKSIYNSDQVTGWITQVCEGLSYLHSKQIIHRDIKPENILLGTSYDDVKLTDFGIARSLEHITHHLTKEIGTPIYMAPEMFSEEDYDIFVDIYSLSITIWEILYRRTNLSVLEFAKNIDDGERPELGNDLSKEVVNLLEICWNVDVSQRLEINDILEFSKNTGFQIPEKQTVLLTGGYSEAKPLDSILVLLHNKENKEDWKKINIKLPYQVCLHGAQFLKNNLYIFGGRNAKEEIMNLTYRLSNRLKWEKMADMNQERERISNSNVILNNRIWVLGGWNGKEDLKSVEMYDPSTNKWEYMKEMNQCRSFAAAAVVNGKIFCCGGGDGEEILNSTECYDTSSDVWTFISSMPLPLWGPSAVTMDGNLIMMGGRNDKEDLKSVWGLNTADKNAVWISKPSMFHPRSFFSTKMINDKIFVCGGISNGWTINDVEMFDGEVWKKGPHLTNFRYLAASTAIPINFGKYLEYGITKFGRTKNKYNKKNKILTIKDINLEKGTILLLGGLDNGKKLGSFLILQNNEENWKELNIKLPHPIHRHGAQFLDNFLYIFGGQNIKHDILNSTYKLSNTFEWEAMTDMNEKRCYISNTSVILNDRIWVLGGRNEQVQLNSVEMYDPSINQWKSMKDMNECRSGAAAAVVNGKIFCCGGWDGEELLSSIECYDPSSDIWTFISHMPLPLLGLGAVAMNKNLVLIGGCNSTEELKSVWELETSNENVEWIEKQSMSIGRKWFSIAKIDDKIFVCGGETEEEAIVDVEIFDGEVWMNGPKLPTPRSDSLAIVIPTNFAEYLK